MADLSVELGLPLARTGNTALVYPALGAVFHLELLEAEDQQRLDRANDLVWDWLGGELRWCALSCARGDEPVRRDHLDYISSYPARVASAGARTEPASLNLLGMGKGDYSVYCNGGGERRSAEASPYLYEFWAEIGYDESSPQSMPAYSALVVTVPEAWPLDDFAQRVTAIGAELRLRWGAAGYMYSVSESVDPYGGAAVRYAHARRYCGYDVAQFVRCMEPFYRRLRTVNWLTFLGPSMEAALKERASAQLVSAGDVTVGRLGDGVVIQAGPRPERGDVNHLQIPAAYRRADAILRPIRADDPAGITFLGPWDEIAILNWLRRFE